MKHLIYTLMFVFLIMTVPGCSGEQPSQQSTVEKRAGKKRLSAKSGAKEDAAEPADSDSTAPGVTEKYTYSPAGKADPFRPLIADNSLKLKADASKNQDKMFLTPLQKYELKDLKLVALVVKNNEPTAMLEDPSGYGYVVRKGMLIGPNEGVVERVTPTGLIIREKFYNDTGEMEPKISTLTIQHVE